METSERILRVALDIIEQDGIAGLTTRAVCEGANVSAPTLYHHFTDKNGLQRAATQRIMDVFLATKTQSAPAGDPLLNLRQGWHGWIDFALSRPNQFRLLVETARTDPDVAKGGYEFLKSIVVRLDAKGRLKGDVDTVSRMLWAASNGVMMLFLQGESEARIRAISDLMIESFVQSLVRQDDTTASSRAS